MTRRDRPKPEPVKDRELEDLDRELLAIDFRERASFDVELRAQLRSPIPEHRPVTGARRRGLALVMAALAALWIRGDAPRDFNAGSGNGAPVLIAERDGSDVARVAAVGLYLAVNDVGRVLMVADSAPPDPPDRVPTDPLGVAHDIFRDGTAFACAFTAERARCGVPEALIGGRGPELARGPFVYRDVCCGRRDPTRPREGALTITGLRDAVAFVFLYVDANGDRRLTPGDRLRVRMHPRASELETPLYADGTSLPKRDVTVVAY